MSAFSSSLIYWYLFFLLETGYHLKVKQNKEQKGRCNQNYGMEDKRIILCLRCNQNYGMEDKKIIYMPSQLVLGKSNYKQKFSN